MSSSAPHQPPSQERRIHHDLRAIFERACKVTAPCFDSALGLGGHTLTTSARRVLHETYPELTQQEIALLFSAVARFHKEKHHG